MQHVGVCKHKVLLAYMFFQKYKNLFTKPQKDFLFFNTFLDSRVWISVVHLLPPLQKPKEHILHQQDCF